MRDEYGSRETPAAFSLRPSVPTVVACAARGNRATPVPADRRCRRLAPAGNPARRPCRRRQSDGSARGWHPHWPRFGPASIIASAMAPRRKSPHVVGVEEALAELRAGRMIVLMDDEDRENEGD